MSIQQDEYVERLYEAILLLQTKEECREFFEDICTIKELIDISQRLNVAEKLSEGKSYTEIASETGASTATICRVNRCFMYGTGGYKSVLGKLAGKDDGGSENENG